MKLFCTVYLSLGDNVGAPPIVKFIRFQGDTDSQRKTAYKKAVADLKKLHAGHKVVKVSPPSEDFTDAILADGASVVSSLPFDFETQ